LPIVLYDDPAASPIYTLSLHDALPISQPSPGSTLALRLLSVDLHVARTPPRPGLRPTEVPLRSVVEQRGRGITKTDRKGPSVGRDRKSTRLNSSHVAISYAVFCLKKKK